MCTVAAAALAVQGVGAAYSAYQQKQAGKAQQGQLNYQAAVDRNNKIISDRYAQDAIDRGKVEEEEQRRKTQQIKGNQRVGFAANGIDLGSDVVTETLQDTAMYGELDALTVRNNAQREAYGYKVQGMNFEASAINNTVSGKNAKTAGKTAAFGTILSGGSSVLGTYNDYKAKGVKVF